MRHAALSFHQFPEETRGRPSITPGLDEDVYHVTVLVDGPPEIVTSALNIHEQFIQTPRVAHPTASAPQPPRVVGPERLTPVPNRLVGHRHTPLGQQVLGIAETEAEAMVQPDGVADDLGWEAVAVVAGHVARHRPTLPAPAST